MLFLRKISLLMLIFNMALMPYSLPCWAQAEGKNFFAVQKEPVKKMFALYDFFEFSYFDISKVDIIIHQSENAEDETNNYSNSSTDTDDESNQSDLKKLIKKQKNNLPEYFYTSLRDKIIALKIPVTLYPKKSPNYSNPIALQIQVERIEVLAPSVSGGKKKNYYRPIIIKINGSIMDKKEKTFLLEFSDQKTFDFDPKQPDMEKIFQKFADDFMESLARYLKTKY